MKTEYKINSLNDTKKLAEEIANRVGIGNVITLRGTLGSGKTFFTSCLINELLRKNGMPETQVLSPTFNIVKEYEMPNYSVYHFDLYRLKNKEELYDLDIENAFDNGIAIVEWPEIAEDLIYNVFADISIEITGEESRVVVVNFAE